MVDCCKTPKEEIDMNGRNTKILLIEDNPADVRLMQEILAEVNESSFDLECVDRLSTGLERLARGGIDVILLDLGLPDSYGLETFDKVHAQEPQIPIVIVTVLDDETFAISAVNKGAQDYLAKGDVDGKLLSRVIRYAIERHRLLGELSDLSLVDELTGLYNQRAFFTLAKEHLKLVSRTKRGIWLLFADFNGLKQINDTLGHNEGNQALIDTASVLKKAFRESDVVARIGGDEFVVLAIGAHKDSLEVLTTGLQKNLEMHNTAENRQYKLSLSVGASYYDPECPCSIDELIARADKSMYQQKRNKN